MSELILSLRSSSPSPSVIFPLRSRIVTSLTTLSSICITLSSNPAVSNRSFTVASDLHRFDTEPAALFLETMASRHFGQTASPLQGLYATLESEAAAPLSRLQNGAGQHDHALLNQLIN